MRRLVHICATLVCAAIFAVVVSFVLDKVNILEKFTVAINDIDVSDIYYQYKKPHARDQNIVLVNIGYLHRSEIAGLFNTLMPLKPKVVGCDALFGAEADSIDPEGTKKLASALKPYNNIVLPRSYHGKDEEGNDLVGGQSPLIHPLTKEGIVNFNIAEDDPLYGTVRSFEPITTINGVQQLSFGFQIARIWNPAVIANAYQGDMMIKWFGYGSRNLQGDSLCVFKTFDWQEIQEGNFQRSDFENKIVLLGFVGNHVGDYDPNDHYFTPLNDKIAGRSLPDMYSAEVHANIIKMITAGEFIHHSEWSDFLFNLTLLSLFMILLIWIRRKYPKQYGILSKIALIVWVDIMAIVTIAIFFWSDGSVKFMIAGGVFIILFVPDTFEFLEENLFDRKAKVASAN